MNNTPLVKIPLAQIAHARSGDKADWVDFGLFAWNEAGYRIIEREVTAAKVQAHFAPWLSGQVDAWPLPNIWALKLVLHGALQGGGARNLRCAAPSARRHCQRGSTLRVLRGSESTQCASAADAAEQQTAPAQAAQQAAADRQQRSPW